MKKCVTYLIACVLVITTVWTGRMPVKADTTSDSVLEMKTSATTLNKGDTVEVTFHVRNLKTSGFVGYLDYDQSVFGTLSVSQLITPDYSSEKEPKGEWQAVYNMSKHRLEVREKSKTCYDMSSVKDALLTIRFTVIASVNSTTIRLDHSTVYKENEEEIDYPSGVSVTINNSKSKKIELKTDAVSGNSSIAIPVNFSKNDGFSTIGVSAVFDSSKLVFDSVTLADAVKNKVTLTNYTVTQSGTKVTANLKGTEEIKTTGVLFYMNFHAINSTTSGTTSGSSATNTSTTVALSVDMVTDKEESAYLLTGTTGNVTITEKEHILGDVNGNQKVDLVDALYVIQYYNKVKTLNSVELKAADANKNGTVDLVDALLIMQYYNGIIKSF